MKRTARKARLADVMNAMESYEGWCTQCADFTTNCVEPDARKRECESCGEKTVYGAGELLFMGLVDTTEDHDTD